MFTIVISIKLNVIEKQIITVNSILFYITELSLVQGYRRPGQRDGGVEYKI